MIGKSAFHNQLGNPQSGFCSHPSLEVSVEKGLSKVTGLFLRKSLGETLTPAPVTLLGVGGLETHQWALTTLIMTWIVTL